MDLRLQIKNYLVGTKMMHLATCVDNKPWVCNAWFAADEDFNIYWFSSVHRRHSEDVTKNPQVAATIVFPQTPIEAPRGLQLEGTVEILEKQEDIDKARSIYEGWIFPKETIDKLMEDEHKFYKLKPTRFVLFDMSNFPNHSKQEYTL